MRAAVVVLLVVATGAGGGCANSKTPCDEIAEQVRERLAGCGVTFKDYDVHLDAECTDVVAQRYACYQDCYDSGSCDDYLHSNQPFLDCIINCVDTYQ